MTGGRASSAIAALFQRWVAGVLVIAAVLALSAPAVAQVPDGTVATRAQDAVDALRGAKPLPQVFAPDFLAAIPEPQVKALLAQLEAQGGGLQGVDEVRDGGDGSGTFLLHFERAVGPAQIQLETTAPYRIRGFRITGLTMVDDGPAKILQDFTALPGNAAFGLFALQDDGPHPILTSRPAEALAVGSAFKLYVLSALAREVVAGRRSWADVVPLTARSLPSGTMHDWPQGAPVTLHTLASMMISISDNSATDALIDLLGRDAVETEMRASGHDRPALNTPFLTTREVFLLKSGPDGELYTYAHGGEQERREMIAAMAGQQPDAQALQSAFTGGPRALDVEWFASAQDLARIMDRLRQMEDKTALAILGINPALGAGGIDPWAYAGFKGGSEPGVLNLTWLLQDKAGRWFVLAMTWNNPVADVDAPTFALLADRLRALARDGGE